MLPGRSQTKNATDIFFGLDQLASNPRTRRGTDRPAPRRLPQQFLRRGVSPKRGGSAPPALSRQPASARAQSRGRRGQAAPPHLHSLSSNNRSSACHRKRGAERGADRNPGSDHRAPLPAAVPPHSPLVVGFHADLVGAVPAEAAPAAARSRHGAAAVPLRRHPPAAGGTAQGGGREGGGTRGAEAAGQPLRSARRRHSAGGTTWGGGNGKRRRESAEL